MREFGIPGKKQTVSRVSILTGLTRKEVQRVLAEQGAPGVGDTRERYNRAARVVAGWVRDPDFADATGDPAKLELDAGRASFALLVKRFEELRPGLDSMAALLVEKEAISGKEALEAVRRGLPESMHHHLTGKASEVRTASQLSTNGHQPPVGLGVPAGQPVPPTNGNGSGRAPVGQGPPPPPPPGAGNPPPR